MSSKSKFCSIYSDIQKCKDCPHVNSEKVLRLIDKTNIKSDIMIIAEAMAPNQVRVSGVNYFDIDGNIGNTGKSLGKFLKKFGYSVYPDNKNCIYHTEIVHCFPGYETKRGKQTIKRPTKQSIINCINKGFIQKEIRLLNPKLIFLMGKTSYESFYTFFLKRDKKEIIPLTQKIEDIGNGGIIDEFEGISLIPLQHASGANPRFNDMLNNEKLLNIIKSIIN